MGNKNKISAAISAVMHYIKAEEEAVWIQSLAAPGVERADVHAAAPVKLWGMSGRQAQMQMRNMMQMRTFR
jgi:hypothetical protein